MKQKISKPTKPTQPAERQLPKNVTLVHLPVEGIDVYVKNCDKRQHLALGYLQDVLSSPEEFIKLADKTPAEIEKISRVQFESIQNFSRVICIDCVLGPVRVVEKEVYECEQNEMSFKAMNWDDIEAIVSVAAKTFGYGGEVAKSAKPFPEEQKASTPA